jgi:hypothetical protein
VGARCILSSGTARVVVYHTYICMVRRYRGLTIGYALLQSHRISSTMASNYESLLPRDCVGSSCKAVPSYHDYRRDVNATYLPHIALIIARQYVHIRLKNERPCPTAYMYHTQPCIVARHSSRFPSSEQEATPSKNRVCELR